MAKKTLQYEVAIKLFGLYEVIVNYTLLKRASILAIASKKIHNIEKTTQVIIGNYKGTRTG